MLLKNFDPTEINLTKYLFFTGKGGVGNPTNDILKVKADN